MNPPSDTNTPPLFTAAKEAVVFMMPLLNMEAFRQRCMETGQVNVFSHGRDLYDHTNRVVTTPNNDTLYSFGWLDLRAGPVRVTMPPLDGRYITLAFLDMYTNNFVVLSERTSGPEGGTFTIIGPDAANEGLPEPLIRSPNHFCLAFARVLVNGPDDLPAARAVQDRFSIEAPTTADPVSGPPSIDRDADWNDFLAKASSLYTVHRPRATDWGAVNRMAPLGMDSFDPDAFSTSEIDLIKAGMAEGRETIRAAMISTQSAKQGWQAPPTSQGDFKQDYLRRAGVSIFGLLALPWEESTCFSGTVFDGQRLDGRTRMRWHLPSVDTIAVDAFWSLTMYEATPDGERYFTPNPINRYAIGDRTSGLQLNADGSLDVWLGHESPGQDRESNWLPAPDGPYCLLLRCYHPRPEFYASNYSQLPEPQKITT